MAEIASAYVSLLPSAKGFGSKLESEIGGDVKSSGKRLGSGFGKMFALGGGLIAAAGIGSILKDSIGEAREAQKVGALTESIIKSTGGAAKITAGQVGELAGALSLKTGMDDEAIQSGANLLLTFKNVKREGSGLNDVFGRATAAATDLSAAGFGDMSGQAKMLGKALNDPVKGISALSRSGVTFSADQQTMIKKMVAANDVLGAQKIILKEVESQVGGAAAASATAGEKASVAFGNLKEDLGTAMLPAIDGISSAFVRMAPAISAGIGKIGPAFKSVQTFLAPAVAQFKTFIAQFQAGTGAGGQFASILGTIGAALQTVAAFIMSNKTAVATFVGIIGTAVAISRAWIAAQTILNIVLSANPIGIVVVAIAALVAGLVIAYRRSDTFRGIVDTMFGALKKVWGVLMQNKQALLVILGPFGLLAAAFITAYKKSETFRKVVNAALNAVKATASAFASFFTSKIPAAFNVVKSAAASALGWVKSNWPTILAILTGPFGLATLAIAKNWNKIESGGVAVIKFIGTIPGKIAAIFTGAAGLLKDAGAKLIAGLIAGITEKMSAAIDAVKGGLSKIRGLLPGSPIKWGPLKSWNNGGAGKRLMGLVEAGIKSATPKTVKAAQTAFDKIADSLKSTRDRLKGELDGFKSDFASLAESVSGAFAGNLFDVSAIDADAEAGIAAKSVGQAFIDNLMGKKAELGGLLASFKTLKGWGLDPAFLSQLFASGQGALITELAGMGQAGARNTASLFGEVTSLGNTLGNEVAKNDPVADRIDETNRLLGEAVRQLNHLGGDIGKELNGAANKARRDKKNRGKKK